MEVLKSNDPRELSSKFNETKVREIDGLLKLGAFEILIEKDAPKTANIVGDRFIIVTKDVRINTEACDGGYVKQGYTDVKKTCWFTRHLIYVKNYQDSNCNSSCFRFSTLVSSRIISGLTKR